MARLSNSLREDTRFRILRLLSENPRLSQRELAEALGISAGSVHYVLGALIEAGVIKLGNFRAAGDRRRYAYLLTPAGVAEKAEGTRRFLKRKVAEFEALRAEIEALQVELGDAGGPAGAGCDEKLARPEVSAAGGGHREWPDARDLTGPSASASLRGGLALLR